MNQTTSTIARLKQHYGPDTKYLFQVLLGSVSIIEANIALDLLLKSIPERDLVAAVNLREALRALPPSPFAMAVDERTLIRVAGLQKNMAVLKKDTPDGYDVIVTTTGNLVLDLIIKRDSNKWFWSPSPSNSDLVTPELIPHIITSDHLLPEVVELIQAMGLVFNPTLYLSLEDWHLEYASETMERLGDLF
ncbi:hypothetical protein EG835_01595 [bacterium]|nr:hypothetical protein [bacterium]